MPLRTKSFTAAGLLVLLVVLGALSQVAAFTHMGLRADTTFAGVRSSPFTAVARGFTMAAQEAVGIGALALGLIVLLLWRRRYDALRLLVAAGGAWVAAMVIKDLLDRPRPPAGLWLLRPDLTGSFPSGHTTTAAVMALIAFVIFRHTRARGAALTLGVLFLLGVGASRLYLGDHYPGDVVGSYLTVAVAALVVSALAELRVVRRASAVLLRAPEIADSGTERPPARAGGRHREDRLGAGGS